MWAGRWEQRGRCGLDDGSRKDAPTRCLSSRLSVCPGPLLEPSPDHSYPHFSYAGMSSQSWCRTLSNSCLQLLPPRPLTLRPRPPCPKPPSSPATRQPKPPSSMRRPSPSWRRSTYRTTCSQTGARCAALGPLSSCSRPLHGPALSTTRPPQVHALAALPRLSWLLLADNQLTSVWADAAAAMPPPGGRPPFAALEQVRPAPAAYLTPRSGWQRRTFSPLLFLLRSSPCLATPCGAYRVSTHWTHSQHSCRCGWGRRTCRRRPLPLLLLPAAPATLRRPRR